MGRILRKATAATTEGPADPTAAASSQLMNKAAAAAAEPEPRVDEEIDELDGTLSEVDASLETDSEETTTTSSPPENKTELPSDHRASGVDATSTDLPPVRPAAGPPPTRMTRRLVAEAEKAVKYAPVREETDSEPSSSHSNDPNGQLLSVFHPSDGVTPIPFQSSHHSGTIVIKPIHATPADAALPSANMRMTRSAARLANISVAEPDALAPTISKRRSRILQQRSAKYKTFDLGAPKDDAEDASTTTTSPTNNPQLSKAKTAINKRQGRSVTKLASVAEETEVVEATHKAEDELVTTVPSKDRKTRAAKKSAAVNVFEDANSTDTSSLAATASDAKPTHRTASKKPSNASSKGPVHLEKDIKTEKAKGTAAATKPSGRGLMERKVNVPDNMNTNTAAERTTRSRLKTTAPSSPVAKESIQNPEPSNPSRITRRRKAQLVNGSTSF